LREGEEQRIAELYDNLSSSYDELYGREQSVKYRIVLEFIGDERFKILVDIGCGSGALLRDTKRHYEYALGIDLSINMLKKAKTRKMPNTDLILASSSMLPIKDHVVDCLVSISTLKADSGLPPFLVEMTRTCRLHSMQAVSLFLEPDNKTPLEMTNVARSSKVSDRETIYFLRSTE
jgi:ubiquinone/menaquinone biosynthesis C-methylase UbiE